MKKFKVGDKCFCTTSFYTAGRKYEIGKIIKVDSAPAMIPYYVEFTSQKLWLTASEIRLANSHIIKERLGIK